MTKLSVNINKIATLRNSRGGDTPNVVQFAKDVQRFGAQGVTVHPRPDQRHIRYQDTRDLKSEVYTEFNVEGNPIQSFIDLVLEVKPTQVTLVPDAVDALTSNAGWDTIKHKDFLTEVITEFNSHGIRTSIFVDPILEMVEGAKITGADRIELYTESFAHQYSLGNKSAIEPFTKAAELSNKIGLGVNAGHDLSLDNIKFFKDNIPGLIAESLYLGIENVVQMYLQRLK
jgi:pyridoxine 5-phosphate synthase